MRSLTLILIFTCFNSNASPEVHILKRKSTADKSFIEVKQVESLLKKADLIDETKSWDQLEKDLLILKSTELTSDELCKEYEGRIPCKKLKLLKQH